MHTMMGLHLARLNIAALFLRRLGSVRLTSTADTAVLTGYDLDKRIEHIILPIF